MKTILNTAVSKKVRRLTAPEISAALVRAQLTRHLLNALDELREACGWRPQ